MSKRFLLLDNDEGFGLNMAMKLSRFAECAVTTKVEDALKLFRRQLKTVPYDAVFMSKGLAEASIRDVWDRMRQFEADSDTTNTFKLVVLTTAMDDIQEDEASGQVDAFIPKDTSEEGFASELQLISLS